MPVQSRGLQIWTGFRSTSLFFYVSVQARSEIHFSLFSWLAIEIAGRLR